tara:strand:+ start:4535 stop:4741 length:207 start_codon:yes stop_codon:yes gene_type:complete
MKTGDLVTFTPEAWGTPLEDRPLGVVVNIENSEKDGVRWVPMITVQFARDELPFSSRRTDFEVVNENW